VCRCGYDAEPNTATLAGVNLSRLVEQPLPVWLIGGFTLVSVIAWVYRPLLSGCLLIPHRVIRQGELHRLFTSAWIHADLGHLFLNAVTLYVTAPAALLALGSVRFSLLYMTAIVASAIPTTLRFMNNVKYASLGASGAICAVMFSSLLINMNQRMTLLGIPALSFRAYMYALAYLVYSTWHSYRNSGNVNHDAHLSGALYGCVFTYLVEPNLVVRSLRQFWAQLGP